VSAEWIGAGLLLVQLTPTYMHNSLLTDAQVACDVCDLGFDEETRLLTPAVCLLQIVLLCWQRL
jgi:hypothetical protein